MNTASKRRLVGIVASVILTSVVGVGVANAQERIAQQAQVKNERRTEQMTLAVAPTVAVVASADSTSTNETTQRAYTPAHVDMVALRRNLEYPARAIAEKIEGKIEIVVYLNDKGEPTNVNFETLSPMSNTAASELAAAAFNALKKCTFTPATRNNVPVGSALRVPFKFML